MSGTKAGAIKARDTNIRKFGADFYHRIGQQGGGAGKGHAFAHGRVSPAEAGRRGGRISTRSKASVSLEYRRAFADFREGFDRPTLRKRLMKYLVRS